MSPILPLFAMLALAPLAVAFAEPADFTGAWVGWDCPSGASRESGQCSSFVLELHQKDGRVCGAHMFANADASDVDEGAAPSVFGEVEEDTAHVVAVSGRTPVRVRADITRYGAALRWKRLDDPTGDYLIPRGARLTRARSKTLFAPVFAQQLNAACTSAFVTAAQRAAPPPAPAADSENPPPAQ